MDDKEKRRHINEYLAMEWGLYDESEPPNEKWPFELKFVGRIGDTDYYRFDDFGEFYYATISPTLLCYHSAKVIDSSDIGARLRQVEQE